MYGRSSSTTQTMASQICCVKWRTRTASVNWRDRNPIVFVVSSGCSCNNSNPNLTSKISVWSVTHPLPSSNFNARGEMKFCLRFFISFRSFAFSTKQDGWSLRTPWLNKDEKFSGFDQNRLETLQIPGNGFYSVSFGGSFRLLMISVVCNAIY